MSAQEHAAPNLATLLERHTVEIATSWTKLVHQLPVDADDLGNVSQTLELTTGSLLAIAEMLRTGSYTTLETHLAHVNRLTMRTSPGIDVVVETLLLLTDAALPVILRTFPAGSEATANAIAQLDCILRWMTGFLARLYSSEQDRDLRDRQQHAEMMLSVARQVSGSLELEDVLAHVCDAVAGAVEGCRCRLYLVEEGRLSPTPNRLEDLPPNDARIARVVESRAPAILDPNAADAPDSASAARCAEGAHVVIAVPFVVRNRPVAVGILCRVDAGRTFTRADLDVAWSIANIVAPVIDNARRHQQVEQLMLRQERDRLSRELHDNLAQALSTLGLKVIMANSFLSANDARAAQAALQEMRGIIDEAYTDVREAIFNLRDSGQEGLAFLPALREYLGDYRLHYGLNAHLEVGSDPLPELPARVRLQLMRIIQEALTNVRKHAGVDEATVTVGVDGEWLYVCIRDEGVGFTPLRVDGDRLHYGLRTMAERAEGIGGGVVYESAPGNGTRVVVRVPRAAER